ncbi:hypothetical protein C2S52_013118 [Perilla frutescens var. hirtella]|nr:hypothetical protein C2S51_015461 [Perilla frutescens var. frutescens]KAH6775557.1 hypothetical protein C2S52_013118 [Perilla frutescens var. hirtella]
MADNGGGGDCARCCCSFILTSGLTALFLWLSLRTYKPTLFIQDFYVPALNKTDNSTAARNNHTISFHLKLKNQMKDKGVGYANISLTFFYNSTLLVANYTLPEFYQGHGKTANRNAVVEATGLPWTAAFAVVSNGTSSVNFRVKVATRVRSKIMLWFTKSHSLVVAGDVAVDGSGGNLKKKKRKIKLKSGVPDRGTHWVRRGHVAAFTFFFVLLF